MTTENTRLFAERLYPGLDRAMKAGGARKLFEHARGYIGSDAVMPKLELGHPGEPIYFGEDVLRPIYELTACPEDQVRQVVKDTPAIADSWKHTTKPYYWPVVLALKWMVENNRPEEEIKMTVMLLTVLIYGGPGIQFKYFRRFYQPNAMAYAINTLSDKFILKQEGTMFKTLLEVAWRSHIKYAPQLREGGDIALRTYFVNLWSRLNGMVRGLKNQYEQVRTKGAYLNQAIERHDDGSLRNRETDGGRVQGTADRLSELFVSEVVPSRAVDLAAQMTDVPRQSLVTAVSEIRNGDPIPVREILRLLVELFFEEERAGPDDLRTRRFLAFSVAVYTRSNTKDGRVERIKAILDQLLKVHSQQYLRTNREATKGAFRKALFLVFVVFCQMRG